MPRPNSIPCPGEASFLKHHLSLANLHITTSVNSPAIDLYISPISPIPLAYFWSTPEHRPVSQLRLHHGRPKPHLRLRRTVTRGVSRSPTSSPTYSYADLPHSPPFSARVSRSIDSIYNFFGLYFVSLFSVCAAQHPANLSH